MRRFALALLAVLALSGAALAGAQSEQPAVVLEPAQARLGERVTLTVEVLAEPGAIVELDLAATDLGPAEIAESLPPETLAQAGRVLHRLRFSLTAFELGEVSLRPAVRITEADGAVQTVALPAAGWEVVSVLAPGEAPQDIRGLQPQMAIEGAGFAYTREFIALGAACAVVALAALSAWLLRRYLRRPRPSLTPELLPADLQARRALEELGALQATQESLPSIYSRLGVVIRRYLGAEYRFPAGSLTAREMEKQMVDRGVHRWQARMATSLLAECDAVSYAGYRPASGRLEADLDMAYQIVDFDPTAAEQAQIISFQRPGVSE